MRLSAAIVSVALFALGSSPVIGQAGVSEKSSDGNRHGTTLPDAKPAHWIDQQVPERDRIDINPYLRVNPVVRFSGSGQMQVLTLQEATAKAQACKDEVTNGQPFRATESDLELERDQQTSIAWLAPGTPRLAILYTIMINRCLRYRSEHVEVAATSLALDKPLLH